MVRLPETWKAVTGHRWLRFFCAGVIFVLILWYPWDMPGHVKSWESHQGDAYYLTPDSSSYIDFKGWSDPWLSIRPIGYPAFLYPFLSRQDKERLLHAYGQGFRGNMREWRDADQPI